MTWEPSTDIFFFLSQLHLDRMPKLAPIFQVIGDLLWIWFSPKFLMCSMFYTVIKMQMYQQAGRTSAEYRLFDMYKYVCWVRKQNYLKIFKLKPYHRELNWLEER